MRLFKKYEAMVTIICIGDETPTMAVGPNDEVFTITSTYDDGYYEYRHISFIENEKLKMIRDGWNNPRKIELRNKPFINNIRKVCRNSLPRKIRQCDNREI